MIATFSNIKLFFFYVETLFTLAQTMKQNDRKSLNANTNIQETLCQMHKL